jgi:3-oxoacyl-[acyl-carrier protein] reductase
VPSRTRAAPDPREFAEPRNRRSEGFHSAGIAGSDFQKTMEAQTPQGRIGQSDDIGPVTVFLASEDARWVTGQVLLVSGGHR